MIESLSIIICTHNPAEAIFSRCLSALSIATIEFSPMEILIIDNNSDNPLSELKYIQAFLNEHKSAQLLSETKLGLTPARLKGIQQAKGNILLFIDDDNIIAPDFIRSGMIIAMTYPHVGSWSGRVILEFEKEPEKWTKQYWGLLVNREVNGTNWSNLPHLPQTMPCGAGMFVRKKVADYYLELHLSGQRKIQLDRSGKSLFSGGDNDLAACACDIGLGMGVFHNLEVSHYIPQYRIKKNYLLDLAENIAASTIVFYSYRGVLPPRASIKSRIANVARLFFKSPIERSFFLANLKGIRKGKQLLKKIK